MLHPLLAMLIFLPILLIITSFGKLILNIINPQTTDPLDRYIFGFGLGAGFLSLLIFLIGILQILYSWSIISLLILIAIVSAKEIVATIKDIFRIKLPGVTVFNFFSILAIILLSGLALIPALSPSSGMDWDGLAYHLAIPKLYLNSHGIIYIPFISHSNFPFLTEMLYTIGLSLNSQSIAKLFHFAMYIGISISIFAMCRSYLSVKTGIYSILLFITVPLIGWEAGIAYTDLSTSLYILLAFYAFINWGKTQSNKWLIIAGISCGFALSTKILAAIPIIAICLLILYRFLKSGKINLGVKYAFITGGIALLIGSPWYIKSFIYTGNPFYPFLYEIFGGKYWSKEAADAYRGSQMAFGMGKSVIDFIMLPWNLIINGIYFFDIPDPNNPKIWGNSGIAFLGLIPATLYLIWNKLIVKQLVFISAITVAVWFFMMQYSRYMITIIPLMSVVVGFGIYKSMAELPRTKYAVNLFFLFCVLSGFFNAFQYSYMSFKAALGLESMESYLTKTLDVYNAQSWMNDNLPNDAKIAVFDEVRCFYLNREYLWANPGHHEMIPWANFKNSQDMIKYFSDTGYKYLFVNMKFASQESQHIKYINESIINRSSEVLFNNKGVVVIKLNYEKTNT